MNLDRLDELFHAALSLPVTRWEAFAAMECRDDPEMQGTLLAMLRAKEDAYHWFAEAEGSLGLFWEAAVPGTVGPYRVLRLLGRGGMGTVYLAERAGEGFLRKVAIKCLRHGGAEFVRRFLEERTILSRLDHPGIARLLDGGRTDDGEPYLVMEYVDGEPLTEWIRRGPPLNERLRLFREIGEAVEFAHKNLVVHRDLKPGNILVTADGQPKLLDFGIAKLLDPSGRSTADTGPGPFTPVYAAPEQLQGGPITTVTDVYGLGAILYELLSGSRLPGPEVTPPAGVEPELGQIACKALERRPEDRYQSVPALLDDVRRFETGLPVRAHGYGFAYRCRKYLWRHRIGACFAVLLAAAVAAFWVQSARLADEQNRADRVVHLVPELFANGHAPEALGRNLPLMRARLAHQPLLWADLSEAAGHIYLNSGDRRSAARLFEEALNTRRRELGESHPRVAETRRHLEEIR